MAHARKLSRAPLVEAIFELHWGLADSPTTLYDEYALTLGQFYSLVKDEYPRREPQPQPPREFFAADGASRRS